MHRVRAVLRHRLKFLAHLRSCDAGTVAAVIALGLARVLLPAAGAAVTGWLLSSLDGDFTRPLLFLGAILLVGQAIDIGSRWAEFLAVSRINLVHRAEVARLATEVATVDLVERDEVQDLLKTAAADPTEWVEKTPGEGAIGALNVLLGYVGLLATAAVVAAWSPWLLPGLILPALLVRHLTIGLWKRHYLIWVEGIEHHRRHQYWGALTASRAEAKELRIFGLADWIIDRRQREMRAHLEPVWADDGAIVRAQWKPFLITLLPLIAVFAAIASVTVDQNGSIGLASAALAASWGVFNAASGVGPMIEMEGSRPGIDALAELRRLLADDRPNRPEQPERLDAGTAEPPLVRLEGVRFGYGRHREVLQGLDLEIRPGEHLAIVGFNGAGKSTLIKLLAGAYRPTGGRITCDGQDIDASGDWRSRLAVVFQDFVRYRLTIAENIMLGRLGTGERDTVAEAAAEAGLGGLLATLPQGLDTSLDRSLEDGADLSGGQWQQLALARALYALKRGAKILILDEPTAHLDVRSEKQLFDRLDGLTEGVTTVLVSHRLSTVRRADRIVLIEEGTVKEQGTHDELMERDGEYARMYRIQAKRLESGFDDRIEEGELI
ncbi:ABC transporter ATP-binding protein/permease [Glycomyces sp. L485]|nr:ABC transporter ATP-binding protein [Glycomyces sp. L485]MCH7230793.1 ABC transporter ATP-binding protein/permease [Glycomyces sp. L485]